MKVALLSDIHGNVPALRTVVEDIERFAPDHVIMNGDVVSRGPLSAPCLALLDGYRQGAAQWHFTRGNHEDYVSSHVGRPPTYDRRFEIQRLSYWTYQQVGADRAAALKQWPAVVELDGGLRATHAAMASNEQGVYADSADEVIRAQIAPPPRVFATGHIHVPYVRQVDETMVVNSGSVGTPFDGDLRASYARLALHDDGWRAEIVRLAYDRDATERDFRESGCLSDTGALTRIIFREWKFGRPMTRTYLRRYNAAILAGEITAEVAVDRFLAEEGLARDPAIDG